MRRDELSNKALLLTKRDSLAAEPALTSGRRAIFIESRFAAERRCWAPGHRVKPI